MTEFGVMELARLEIGREGNRRDYTINHIIDIMKEIRHYLDIQHRNKKVNQSKLRNKQKSKKN